MRCSRKRFTSPPQCERQQTNSGSSTSWSPSLAALNGQAGSSAVPGRVWGSTAERGRQVQHRVGDWLTSPVHRVAMSINSPLIGETNKGSVCWRAPAALQGPCFLVLAEFAGNPLSYPQHWLLCHMGGYKIDLYAEPLYHGHFLGLREMGAHSSIESLWEQRSVHGSGFMDLYNTESRNCYVLKLRFLFACVYLPCDRS